MKKSNSKKKSIFRRWWFWVIVIFAFVAVTGGGTDEDVIEDIDPPAAVETEIKREPLVSAPVTVESEPAIELELKPEPESKLKTEPEPKVESEPAPIAEPESAPTQADSIFGSVNSDKYHNRVCSTWTQSILDAGNAVYFESEADAEAHGYQPCGKCYGS